MRSIKLLHVLLEYDYPQVFVGVDAIGCRFVCMVSAVVDYEPTFLCVPISDQRFRELCNEKIDLRSVYASPEVTDFYEAKPIDLISPFDITQAEFSVVPEELLPEAGLVFQCGDEVLNKAQELNSTVAYASLSVPESVHEARIRTRKLSEFLAVYQAAIKYLARFAAKANGKPIPKNDDPYESDVFGFCHGSFTVQVRGAQECDMLGENKALVTAFSKLNEFLSLASDPDEALKFLLEVKGHTASSLINLLTFVKENDCALTNRWSTPGMPASTAATVRALSAVSIINKCRLREDLSTEEVVLEGIVDSADVSGGTWKIICEGVAHHGAVKPGSEINLAGITLGNQYRFKCEEKIEVVAGTGKETRKLSLTGIEPA
ncbi:hypothetical protein K5D32_02800 [Pseudomonas cichorii]|uniref:DUF6575 domain-containing protein n=1 Tax=Pseudomonas cichorii TaxID=36746 RepID=UPI001C89F66B|nr:DUF6575 domain-containing protein [Pseudomonas cichorii]MBX8528573.1 hypothetical protein [Pseudomonas cichorii]